MQKLKLDEGALKEQKMLYRHRLRCSRLHFYERIAKEREIAGAIEQLFGVYGALRQAAMAFGDERFVNLIALKAGARAALALLHAQPAQAAERAIKMNLLETEPLLLDDLMREYLSYIDHGKELRSGTISFLSALESSCSQLSQLRFPELAQLVESTSVELNGIELLGHKTVCETVQELPRLTLDEIVGNENVKAALKMGIEVALCYDPASRANALAELGFQRAFFIYGRPGCGKSSTIRAALNYGIELARRCQKQFKIRPLSNALKSEFYSKSVQNLRRALEEVRQGDASWAIVADDIDTIFIDREGARHSPEDKSLLGELLNFLEGIEGEGLANYIFVAAANRELDPALAERLQEAALVARGPESATDYAALLKLKLRKALDQGLVEPGIAWQALGARCAALALSGRAIKNIVVSAIASAVAFERAPEFYSAPIEQQRASIRARAKKITQSQFEELIENYARAKP